MTVKTTSYCIPELEPFTTHEIRVAAVDGNQTGAFSGPVQVQTLEKGRFETLQLVNKRTYLLS